MIEAEVKAHVREPEHVMAALEERAQGRAEVYEDTYFDTPTRDLDREDRELRVRTVHGPDSTRSVLTYKGARVDDVTGSKPESESVVEDAEAVKAILRGLGYAPSIAFSKRCRNYTFEAAGRRMLATLVRIPELDGTYIELETMVTDDTELPAALDDVRSVLRDLGIEDKDLTNELYTDAVAARR